MSSRANPMIAHFWSMITSVPKSCWSKSVYSIGSPGEPIEKVLSWTQAPGGSVLMFEVILGCTDNPAIMR